MTNDPIPILSYVVIQVVRPVSQIWILLFCYTFLRYIDRLVILSRLLLFAKASAKVNPTVVDSWLASLGYSKNRKVEMETIP